MELIAVIVATALVGLAAFAVFWNAPMSEHDAPRNRDPRGSRRKTTVPKENRVANDRNEPDLITDSYPTFTDYPRLDPTPTTLHEPYIGEGGDFGGAGASGSWSESDPGSPDDTGSDSPSTSTDN